MRGVNGELGLVGGRGSRSGLVRTSREDVQARCCVCCGCRLRCGRGICFLCTISVLFGPRRDYFKVAAEKGTRAMVFALSAIYISEIRRFAREACYFPTAAKGGWTIHSSRFCVLCSPRADSMDLWWKMSNSVFISQRASEIRLLRVKRGEEAGAGGGRGTCVCDVVAGVHRVGSMGFIFSLHFCLSEKEGGHW